MRDISFINKKISKEKNIDISIVEKVNKYYWKEVRKQLVSLDDTGIHIKNLLTFSASRFNVRKEITNVIKRIRLIKNNNKYKNKELLLSIQIEILRRLLKIRNKLAILYNELYYNE